MTDREYIKIKRGTDHNGVHWREMNSYQIMRAFQEIHSKLCAVNSQCLFGSDDNGARKIRIHIEHWGCTPFTQDLDPISVLGCLKLYEFRDLIYFMQGINNVAVVEFSYYYDHELPTVEVTWNLGQGTSFEDSISSLGKHKLPVVPGVEWKYLGKCP